MTYRISYLSVLALLSACAAELPPEEFKQRSPAEISKIVGNIEEPSTLPWLNFVFDLQIIAGAQALLPFNESLLYPERKVPAATHVLIRPSSIGSHNGAKRVHVSTGLWPEHSLKRAKAYITIELPLKPTETPGGLTPDIGARNIKAWLACEDWAQAMTLGNSASPDYERLKQAFINNWQKDRSLAVSAPLAPYKVGAYWVVPVEISLEKSDFAANCL